MTDDFGVPAGWYPDPLGLPQLRWWDSQAWTEHTSEARAPIVIQPATRSADDAAQLPSRREQRERERRESLFGPEVEAESDLEQDELSAQPLLAMTLRELEPPLTDTVDEATPGPRRASAHANAVPAASTLSAFAEELAPERELKQTRTYTGAVWAIAFMPLLQLLTIAILITAGLGENQPLIVTVVVAPYLLVLGFAFYDRLLLQVWGHSAPASPLWALLTEPGYLIARAVRTIKETGKGFAPIAGFGASIVALLAGMLVLPGILISLFPATFAGEVEQSVRADAAALGADITLHCPTPPLLIGDTVTCTASKPNGDTDSIVVSLQRENGWIAWRVEDWGNWVLAD